MKFGPTCLRGTVYATEMQHNPVFSAAWFCAVYHACALAQDGNFLISFVTGAFGFFFS